MADLGENIKEVEFEPLPTSAPVEEPLPEPTDTLVEEPEKVPA